MTLDRTTTLFLDASALFAATLSPQGGSRFLVLVCARGYLQVLVSPDVLVEVERNLVSKTSEAAVAQYHDIVSATPLHLVSAPSEALVTQYAAVFFEDAHVVAAALAAGAHYLITLDKGLQARIRQAQAPVIVLSPKEFIQTILPSHPDYRDMRGS